MITLLLVDDEPMVLHGLHMWLGQAPGITVIGEASNGTEAIAMAKTLQPDVIVMDIFMPKIDGITATEALHIFSPHSAVVLLTIRDDADIRRRANAAGAVTVVGKQEGVKTLLAAIYTAGEEHGHNAHPFE
jgi:DNA-binding NarL/FixJ family response regulator